MPRWRLRSGSPGRCCSHRRSAATRSPTSRRSSPETHGLAEAIDAAWMTGDLDACNQLEVRLWLDGPAEPEGRVSGHPRELALEMNRTVLANGEAEVEGGGGVDAAT